MGNTLIVGHQILDDRIIYTHYSHMQDWPATDGLVNQVKAKCNAEIPSRRWVCATPIVKVARNQPIGRVGQTSGRAAPPPAHLHFEIKLNPKLSSTVNDGAASPDSWGYRGAAPEDGGYLDPLVYFHPDARPFASPRALRLASTSPVDIRMGPGGEVIGGTFVRYRPIDTYSVGMNLEAIATARISPSGSCDTWYRVRRTDAQRFVDRRDPEPSAGRFGEQSTGWVCTTDVADAPPATIFASSLTMGASPSDLFEVGVSPTGVDRRVGRIRTSSGVDIEVSDIASAPDGTLYGISFSALYQIDRATAIGTLIGNITANGTAIGSVNALTVSPIGDLYAATIDGQLLRRVNGVWQLVGSYGAGFGSTGDIVFAPSGELYGMAFGNFTSEVLVKIDITTGRVTPIATGGGTGYSGVWGLSFVGGGLYGMTSSGSGGELLRIDLVTGGASRVRNLTFGASGGGKPPLMPARFME